MEALQKAIEHFGGSQRALAAAIDCQPAVITNWKRRGVSVSGALKIEIATEGAVTRAELRPEIFGSTNAAA